MSTENDSHFMRLALQEAKIAYEQNEFPVGCIIVTGNDVIARGSRKHSLGQSPNELDHAEMNALRALWRSGKTADSGKSTLYCTMEPCLMCYGAILLSNIHRIVYAYEDAMGGGVNLDLSRMSPLYRHRDIEITPHVMRSESLKLFKAFFNKPDNLYWKDSYLSQYTLKQQA